MVASVTTPMQEGFDGELPIPSDYLKLAAITVGNNVMRKRDLETVLRLRANGVSDPLYFVERGQSWSFGPMPAVGTEFRIDYYQEIPHLTNADDTNWLSLVKPFAIIDGALVRAARHFVDRRLPDFERAFASDIAAMQSRADEDALVDAVMTPGFSYPEDC
jgi:hypothetical protein